MNLTTTDVLQSMRQSVVLSGLIITALLGTYLLIEPTVGRAVSDQFTITQDITAEISFTVTAADVALASIPGLTGGTATGSTQVVVQTNNALGYAMTIEASNTPAMVGDVSGDNIPDYTPAVANVPDFSHTVAANTAEFGYTVSASNTTDLAQKFLDNGSICNVSTSDTGGTDSCWYNLSTTATSTVNRATPTDNNGATTTFTFVTLVNSNPAPALTQDLYTATATLTATTN